MTALVVLEGCAIALLTLLVAGLLRSHAEILRRLHDLGAGLQDPSAPAGPADVAIGVRPGLAYPPQTWPEPRDVVGETPSGEAAAIAVGGSGTAAGTLLAFLSSGCGTCAGFWRAFAEPARLALPAGVRLVVVTKGLEQESVTALRELAPPGVTVVASTAAWTDYAVPVAPYFIYVRGRQVVGAGAAATWEQVARLFEAAYADERDNAARVDAELLAAGIGPGHPSLYGPAGE